MPSWSPFCPGSGWPHGPGAGHLAFPWPGILGSTVFPTRSHSARSPRPGNRIRRQWRAQGADNLLRDVRLSCGLSSCTLRLRISPFSPLLPNERLYYGPFGVEMTRTVCRSPTGGNVPSGQGAMIVPWQRPGLFRGTFLGFHPFPQGTLDLLGSVGILSDDDNTFSSTGPVKRGAGTYTEFQSSQNRPWQEGLETLAKWQGHEVQLTDKKG